MRLLIAEDEKPLADALCEILTLHKYSVDVVYDGEEALDYLQSDIEYDGVILDIMMPKMDGIAVLKTMRKNKINTPTLMLTAKSEIDDKVLGLDSGANDYLTKPFETKELLARIRAMIRRERKETQPVLTLGNITFSSVTYELSSTKDKVLLTNKEYQLMEMLFHHVGNYISSEQFMDKIWGFNSDSEINVVWSHLSSLRKKLEYLDANIKIKSLRNLGYTLEVKDD